MLAFYKSTHLFQSMKVISYRVLLHPPLLIVVHLPQVNSVDVCLTSTITPWGKSFLSISRNTENNNHRLLRKVKAPIEGDLLEKDSAAIDDTDG